MLSSFAARHESDGGWLGTGDSAGSCATDYAEEQLAGVIARQGGFGLGKLVLEGLGQPSGGNLRQQRQSIVIGR